MYANGVTEIDEGREKPRKEKTQAEKEAAKCPRCNAFWPGRSDTCACCGFVRARRNEVIETPGELQELMQGANTKDRAVKQDWYSQLLTIAQDRGYSDGWVSHKFKEKFTVWPRGVERVAAPVSIEVARWVKSRQIAWAKSRKAA